MSLPFPERKGAGKALASVFFKKDGTTARYFRIIYYTEANFNGNRSRYLKILFCYMSFWLYYQKFSTPLYSFVYLRKKRRNISNFMHNSRRKCEINFFF